ncbi:FadR/GntR family transcriptional regulator [Fusobacterium necrophorum]|uniref:FadR/GntR family transcriptional regulator n=1 Tax=Fusobacterium necrophorum TaxID=859 RepID=UPI00078868B8|nr:FadR/GntR family transcriptional regulator [Fusobacterium necrophorum]KYM43997.1 GntR family transcriptional regulator [Fusobacterium necrophorum subsp. funduliforme]
MSEVPISNTKKNNENKAQYLKVIDKIKEKIFSGKIKIGDKLPPERDLAEEYKVGRPSIREAVRGLEILGLLEVKQGSGTYVRNNIEKLMVDSLDIIYNTNNVSDREVIEFREMFEYSSVKLAALNATDEEIAELECILRRMKETNSSQELEELDLSFHEQIAVMSHNILIMETFVAIRNFFNRCIKNSVHLIYLNGEKNQDIIDYHIYIFDAIKDRDSTVALIFMERHFRKVRELILK